VKRSSKRFIRSSPYLSITWEAILLPATLNSGRDGATCGSSSSSSNSSSSSSSSSSSTSSSSKRRRRRRIKYPDDGFSRPYSIMSSSYLGDDIITYGLEGSQELHPQDFHIRAPSFHILNLKEREGGRETGREGGKGLYQPVNTLEINQGSYDVHGYL